MILYPHKPQGPQHMNLAYLFLHLSDSESDPSLASFNWRLNLKIKESVLCLCLYYKTQHNSYHIIFTFLLPVLSLTHVFIIYFIQLIISLSFSVLLSVAMILISCLSAFAVSNHLWRSISF